MVTTIIASAIAIFLFTRERFCKRLTGIVQNEGAFSERLADKGLTPKLSDERNAARELQL